MCCAFDRPQSPVLKMQSPKTFLRSLVLMTIIASVFWAKADAEKYVSCCTAVSDEVLMDPIIGFKMQRAENHCVEAMILKTEKNEDFCCPLRSAWVRTKIEEFMRNLRKQKHAENSVLSRIRNA